MKKGIIIIVIAVIAAIAATAAALYFLGGEPLSKTVSLNGYEISVPKDWVASADGTLTPEIERTDYLPEFGKDWNESEKIKK